MTLKNDLISILMSEENKYNNNIAESFRETIATYMTLSLISAYATVTLFIALNISPQAANFIWNIPDIRRTTNILRTPTVSRIGYISNHNI